VPRPPRIIHADQYYHVLNRANRKAEVFHSPRDYAAFVELMSQAQQQRELPIIAACLMPNHVHIVARPRARDDLTKWMHWLFTTHARRYNDQHGSSGHVWQDRFKAFMAQDDQHLITVMRYVERNALRAKLVERAQDWAWGSLHWRTIFPERLALTAPPEPLPSWWVDFVNQAQTAAELAEIRASVNRQRPFGAPDWVKAQAAGAELNQSLVSPGRPRKRARECGTVS
jgi:putative transposase